MTLTIRPFITLPHLLPCLSFLTPKHIYNCNHYHMHVCNYTKNWHQDYVKNLDRLLKNNGTLKYHLPDDFKIITNSYNAPNLGDQMKLNDSELIVREAKSIKHDDFLTMSSNNHILNKSYFWKESNNFMNMTEELSQFNDLSQKEQSEYNNLDVNSDKTISGKKNSYLCKVNNPNIVENLDTSINHEITNLNDNKNTGSTNRIDQTLISDYINPDVDDAISNMDIESDNKNILSNNDETNDRLSKELNKVMDKVKRENISHESNRLPTANVSTTTFNCRPEKKNNGNFILKNKVYKSRFNVERENKTNELGEAIFPISCRRRITVRKWQGNVLVDIREHYLKEDLLLPSKKGISLTLDQYKKLRKHIMDGSLDLSTEYLKEEIQKNDNEISRQKNNITRFADGIRRGRES